MYQEILRTIVGEILPCRQEIKNIHNRDAIAATKRLPGRLANVIVGNLQKESSRVTRFILLTGGVINFEVIDSKHRRRSPVVQFQLKSLLK